MKWGRNERGMKVYREEEQSKKEETKKMMKKENVI
jgi:hypothetical protein